MKDSENPQDCYLYKLSQKPGFEWFKNVFLFSSIQDNYVQFDSARIQIFQDTKNLDQRTAKEYLGMVNNLMSDLPQRKITRVDVNF